MNKTLALGYDQQFQNFESSMKNTLKGLEFIYNSEQQSISSKYINVVIGFYNYVKNNKIHIAQCTELYTLARLISILKHPPVKYPIGSSVLHTVSLSKYTAGIIDDYDYTLNLYQLKYNSGRIEAWIPETEIQMA
jgi:hypothetical protein